VVGELTALNEEDFAGVDVSGDPVEELARLVVATITAPVGYIGFVPAGAK
jgi:hypothetical protein